MKTLLLFFVICQIASISSFYRNFERRQSIPYSDPCPFQPVPVPLTNVLSRIEPSIEKVKSILESMISLHGNKSAASSAGISANLVYQGDVIWSWNAGITNINKNSTADEDTIYRIGSISKLFVGIMAFQLYQQGTINSLDDPISKYEPRFSILNPFNNEKITFRQILSQTSGLPRSSPCKIDDGAQNIEQCNCSFSKMYEKISQLSLLFPPWKTVAYSNLGFALLGNIMSTLLNTSFEEYTHKYILEPLNMTSTGFEYNDSVLSRLAIGYDNSYNRKPTNLANLYWEAPSGQMYSTTRDLAKLSSLFLSSSSEATTAILTPALLQEMMRPTYLWGDGMTAIASPFESTFQNNYLVKYKGGNIWGYSGLFSILPELGFGVTLLWNGDVNELAAQESVYSVLIPAFYDVLLQNQLPPQQPPNATEYAGVYTCIGGGCIMDNLNISLVTYRDTDEQVLSIDFPGSSHDLLLAFISHGHASGLFQIVSSASAPCITTALYGLSYSSVQFSYGENGQPVNLTLPRNWGYFYQKTSIVE